MITDLTEGKIRKTIWLFSMPLLLSIMFQQVYNIADSMIAGRFVGEEALAAVGASQPVTLIFMAIAFGCNIGCSVVISQLFGGKKYREMKTAINTTLIAALVLSSLLTILGLAFRKPIMRLINTPDNIFADAVLYLNIYIGGLVFLFLYNICTGIFTALGDSKTPLYFLIASSIGNIILDVWFVTSFKMGVAGVAWATFIAQGLSGILAFITLQRRLRKINVTEKVETFSFPMLKQIALIAIPSILQQSSISIGNMILQGAVNGYGSSVIAGYSSAMRLNAFAISALNTTGNGISSFTAQNIGANKRERVKTGYKEAILMSVIVAMVFVGCYFFFSRQAIGLFMENKNGQAIATGVEFLKIVSPFYFVIGIKQVADGVLRGAGKMRYFTGVTVLGLILRTSISLVLERYLGTKGIWLGWPIGWSIVFILSTFFVHHKVIRSKVE